MASLLRRVSTLEAPAGPRETGRLEALLGSAAAEATRSLIGELRAVPERGQVPSARLIETEADLGAGVPAAFGDRTPVWSPGGSSSRPITTVV